MECKKCGSENLVIVKSGPHQKLVCGDCLAYQKFLSRGEATTWRKLEELERLTNPVEGDIQDRKEVNSHENETRSRLEVL